MNVSWPRLSQLAGCRLVRSLPAGRLMLSRKHSKLFLEVGSTGLFLETWVTLDDIHQHTCMLYPVPDVTCREWWLEVTSFGIFDPPISLLRQETPRMAMELSVYISVLFTVIFENRFQLARNFCALSNQS